MPDNPILIVAEVLQRHLDDPDWAVIDARFDLADPQAGLRHYGEAHIPGAIYLDLDADLAGPIEPGTGRHPLPDAEKAVAKLEARGIGSSHQLVVYDAGNGAVAARAWWVLRWLGHDAVFVLDGGFARWQRLGYATESGAVSRPWARFLAVPRDDLVLTTAELERNLGTIERMNLLDARDAARFRGEVEPIDPVAGHIPGARSVPFGDFVADDGTWLALDARRKRLLDALGGKDDAAWSVMCGSGVTACHLAITGVEAGLPEPRLYVGSWSEWIRDPQRPVATGSEP
ncbi:MAG: sulfurtransferase [Gammaproteobacteria bacterium]|nr:sulfurtransferase [Gammaproteobacteria bacterium]NNF48636.1 sulfurtransferase [Woeseiaceae bacterium]MBT8095267.1 sulfurtransferase [Gammaproteobacteria bacterium]MBT8105078.1 sulfurtransferase [Gammaproteobacteria bacterium]NNK25092.1 sulfurtransferase [Woeseiaceae bacterium]